MAETNPSPNGARSRNQVSHEARWEEIVDASAQVFHEVGYQAATVKEIASRVGILKGSLYYYIESKQDLLLAVIKREHERGLTTIEEDAAARAAPPPERLAAFIRRWMRITLETAPNSRSAVNEMRHLDQEHGDLVRSTRTRIHEFVRGVIVDGIDAGDFDAVHPGVATNSLFALMDGTLAWYREAGSLSPAEIADWYVTLFVAGLGREEASCAAAAGERRAAP